MRLLLLLLLLASLKATAHPGIAIVKDSHNNIYYSNLQQVWKISNGQKTIVVPHVHTHELYMDVADNLHGAHEYNNEAADSFYHYLWRLQPNGQLDTIIPAQLAYQQIDFALSRDAHGNQYYIKRFIRQPDEAHIYKQSPDGKETVFASGNFKGITWLHPQADGSLLFVQHNHVYRAGPDGTITTLATNIANEKPSFHFSGNSKTVWGVWQDAAANVYVAVFSDQAVKKIEPNGRISTYYQSTGNWAPTHGVFDEAGRLWLLESSDKNEIRAIKVSPATAAKEKTNVTPFISIAALGLLAAGIRRYFVTKRKTAAQHFSLP